MSFTVKFFFKMPAIGWRKVTLLRYKHGRGGVLSTANIGNVHRKVNPKDSKVNKKRREI